LCTKFKAAQNHRQKEILQAQYKINDSPPWYTYMASAILASVFFGVLDAILLT
jgi:hypothetical protein